MLAGLALVAGLGGAGMSGGFVGWIAALGLFILLGAFVAGRMRRFYPHPRLGACNVVTLLRLALTCAMIPPLLAHQPGGWMVALLAFGAMLLDGMDGWLARRSGLASAFGARFDIEADAALALVLSLHAVAAGVGIATLLLGVMRYVFVAAGWIWPWLAAPLAPSLRRKLICVAQLSVLVLLQLPALPPVLSSLLAWTAILGLTWSFGTDVARLWRART